MRPDPEEPFSKFQLGIWQLPKGFKARAVQRAQLAQDAQGKSDRRDEQVLACIGRQQTGWLKGPPKFRVTIPATGTRHGLHGDQRECNWDTRRGTAYVSGRLLAPGCAQ